MELKIQINNNCEECLSGLRYFNSLRKKHKNHYINMNLKTYLYLENVILTPDYNSCGNLTHFHISRGNKETYKNIIAKIEVSEVESKKILGLKKFEKLKNG
jgi:hypothetical protein